MIRRALSFLRRYVQRNGQFTLRRRKLRDADGALIAYIDRMEPSGTAVHLSGWALAPDLHLQRGTAMLPVTRRFVRHDVPGGAGRPAGFSADILWSGEPLTLRLGPGPAAPSLPLRRPGWVARAVQVPLILARLGITLARHHRDLRLALRHHDRAAHDRLRAALGMTGAGDLHRLVELPEDLLPPGAAPVPAAAAPQVSLVIPVYNAFDLLPEMLDRVLRHTDLPAHVILIEDASTDNRVRPWLRDWSGRPVPEGISVELLENDTNLGFIGSVNRGFARALWRGGPVILLNSDAMVPPGWASRLVAPLLEDPQIASVTPMSNDAEIFSVPVICQRRALQHGQGDRIDAAARRLNGAVARAVAPTGVGFCMAIRPEFLRQVPAFDTAFGRGYGEEVDWCQKIRALGGRHLGIANLFVEHRGGASFGSAEKQALVARNNAQVAARYQSYDRQVQDFIAADPLAGPRAVLGLAWAFSQGRAPLAVLVGHALGGGAEHYLQRRLKDEIAANGAAVVLRLGGAVRWQVELHGAEGAPVAGLWEPAQLQALFALAGGARRLIYSCAVGDPDPVQVPDVLLSLYEPDRDRIEILFHDFFPLSPAYTLLAAGGHYRGVPGAGSTDAAHRASRPDGTPVPLAEWRRTWGELAAAADRLTVFSASSAAIVAEAYPEAAPRIVVQPHADVGAVPRCTAPAEGPASIGVLGDIGVQKGAEVLQRLAPALAAQGARLTVIGNIDPNYPLPRSCTVHGRYDLAELDAIAARYGVDRWFIPSIWPETFSYTTHEALATGLPVYCFDLGGQGEAVGSAASGHLLPLALADDAAALAVALTQARATFGIQNLDSSAAAV